MIFKEFNSASKVVPYANIAAGLNMNKNLSANKVWGDYNSTDFYNSFAIDIGGGASIKTSDDFEIDLEFELN